jgi:regulator of protease activity HflC (stomatin/prohibitin superfamily)
MHFVTFVLFLLALGWAAWKGINWTATTTDNPVKPRGLVQGGLLLIVALLFSLSVGEIDAGERGVVLRFGAVTGRIIEPGIYLVTPFVETVETMDVTIQADTAKASASTKDLQIVSTQVTLNYSLSPNECARVFDEIRHNAKSRIVTPAIQEAVKAATPLFNAEELITRRADAKAGIERILAARLQERGFQVDTINITDFDFSTKFNEAIELKQTAIQDALRAQNDLERVKMEGEQAITLAKAQAEALRVQKEAVSPGLIELRRMEALLAAVEKWDGVMPQFVMGSSGGGFPVPVMDVFKAGQTK